VPVEIPPLRERPGEVAPLAHHLLARVGAAAGRALSLGDDALAALEAYAWPGNVRQLENALEHAVAVCRGQTIHAEDLPKEVRDPRRATPARLVPPHSEVPIATQVALATPGGSSPPHTSPPHTSASHASDSDADEIERIKAALEAHRWNRGAAAQVLGMSRTTLWRKLRALGLD